MAVDMNYGIGAAGTIRVEQTVYVFGGYDGSYQNKWQYYNLPDTISPTAAPSTSPSTITSRLPSNAPIAATSGLPTRIPIQRTVIA
eukprot:68632_1